MPENRSTEKIFLLHERFSCSLGATIPCASGSTRVTLQHACVPPGVLLECLLVLIHRRSRCYQPLLGSLVSPHGTSRSCDQARRPGARDKLEFKTRVPPIEQMVRRRGMHWLIARSRHASRLQGPIGSLVRNLASFALRLQSRKEMQARVPVSISLRTGPWLL